MFKTHCYTALTFFILTVSFLPALCAKEYKASTAKEVQEIDSKLQPGDVLMLSNGTWNDAALLFTASGTADKHIIIRAQEAGKVFLSGNSSLRLAGNYIDVSGLYFINGSAEDDVIAFRKDSKQVANNCRVSNCAIINYNPSGRTKENNWITFFGRNNRFDHNYVADKKNLGPTLVVELNDVMNQQNYHRIDSNYFGRRERMGANGGETMRIGNSTYSRTSSNTIIENNFFDRCSGEVEIISIKSCDNIIRGNTFWECEGNVVLRHGNRNLVEANRFIGNNKPLTGGVRVINAGHKILNNYFYKLKGERFRSALAIMNGVPNSPINRYDPVRDVVISGNTFIDCDNIELCAGKDFERTATPKNVLLAGNVFYHSKPVSIFHVYDDISGITFKENLSNRSQLKTKVSSTLSITNDNYPSVKGLTGISIKSFSNADISAAKNNTGAGWLNKNELYKNENRVGVKIQTMPGNNTLYDAVLKAKPNDIIVLSNSAPYYLSKTIEVRFPLHFIGEVGASIEFEGEKGGISFFSIENGGALYVSGIDFNGESKNGIAESFIRTSKQPTIDHYNLFVNNCSFKNLTDGRKSAFKAFPGTFADSIVFMNCLFTDITGEVISLAAEKEDKGYYNAENIVFKNCVFNKILMGAIDIYRGGNDESTAGPFVTIDHCTFNNVGNTELGYAVRLHGVQYSKTTNTLFNNSGKSGRAVWFEDFGWTSNSISNSNLFESGKIESFYGNVVKGKLDSYQPAFNKAAALDFSLLTSSPLKNKGSDKKDVGAIFQNGKLH